MEVHAMQYFKRNIMLLTLAIITIVMVCMHYAFPWQLTMLWVCGVLFVGCVFIALTLYMDSDTHITVPVCEYTWADGEPMGTYLYSTRDKRLGVHMRHHHTTGLYDQDCVWC